MTVAYPTILPRPQRDGYMISVSGATIGTARERTAARCRSIGLGSRTTASLTWIFTADQFAFFAGWWRYDLQQGTELALIVLPNGNSDEAQPVRFIGPYAADDMVGRWKVSATVELTNPPRISSDDIAELLTLGAISLPAGSLHYLIHILMPPRITL